MRFGLLGIPLDCSPKTSQQSYDVGLASSIFWIRGIRVTEVKRTILELLIMEIRMNLQPV